MNRLKEYLNNAIMLLILGGCIAVVAAVAFAPSYACHRWVGPWMTSGDATAVAVFCRPGR
jgi:hypothetical protein